MAGGRIADFRVTRLQFRRDRRIGDSQVTATQANIVALELIDEAGRTGLGFVQILFQPLMSEAGIESAFRQEAFPNLEGREASALALQVSRPRGGRCGTCASSRRLPATRQGARSWSRRGTPAPGAAS